MLEPAELEQFVTLVRARLACGAGYDDVLALLRDRGLHKIESMRVLNDATGLGLGEVKQLVHESPVWDDRRASDEAFHESLVRGLDALAEQGETEINP